MCLGVPGEIVELSSEHEDLAQVDVGGVRRTVNVALLADAPIVLGDWVLIHVGFAIARIDESEARLALASLRMLGADGELDELGSSASLFDVPDGWEATP